MIDAVIIASFTGEISAITLLIEANVCILNKVELWVGNVHICVNSYYDFARIEGLNKIIEGN